MYLKQTEWGCDCAGTAYVYRTKIDIDLTPEEVEKFNLIFDSDPEIEIISDEQNAKEEKEDEERWAKEKAERAKWAEYYKDESPYFRLMNAFETEVASTLLPKLQREERHEGKEI